MMTDKITLEDINTWLLKYGELDAPKYALPHVEVIGSLYRGNLNTLSDVLGLPTGVEYTVYYENRPLTELSLPVDYGDTCTLRVVTKSHYPYVNSDVKVTVPVETKHLQSLNDLNSYDYGYIDNLTGVSGSITNDITIVLEEGALLSNCSLSIDAEVTLNGELTVENTFIRNNSTLTFDNVSFTVSDTGLDYLIVNNGNLSILNSSIVSTLPFILNNGSFSLSSNTVECNNPNVPFIYSSNNDLNVQDNTVSYSSLVEYTDFGVCFIRVNDYDIDKLVYNNSFTYENVAVNIDGVDYLLNGSGVCYARLDDDTVYVKDLEVI